MFLILYPQTWNSITGIDHDYSLLQNSNPTIISPLKCKISTVMYVAAVTALKVVKQTKTDSRWAPSEHELWRILRLLRWTAFDQPMMVIETSSRSFLPQQLFWSEFPIFVQKLQFIFAFKSTINITHVNTSIKH